MLAITFTLNACGDDDNSGDGGIDFNENSQIYNEDGTKFTLSGTIKAGLCGGDCYSYDYTLIDAGSVTNGVVNLKLPQTIPDELLHSVGSIWEEGDGCTVSDISAKISEPADIVLYNGNENVGNLTALYEDAEVVEFIYYIYAPKAVNINCDIANMKYVKGWNKLYVVASSNNEKFSTDNILTKELKWTLRSRD
jgi:hypothetical protein